MSFELIILGSSSALPTSKRSATAHLLNVNERFFLIDCGEGTQMQLRRFGLSIARINNIFISHLHGDHVFGLFGMLSSLGLMGRSAPVNLYGPADLKQLLESHFRIFGKPPFEVAIHSVSNNKLVMETSKLEVRAIRLEHRTETFGYLFKEKPRLLNVRKESIEKYSPGIADIKKIKEGSDYILPDGTVVPNNEMTLPPLKPRSYAYISDTRYMPELFEVVRGVDLLYHEATFLERDRELAVQTFHSTAKEAAQLASAADAGKLLLGHFSTRYKDTTQFEEEASEIFNNVVAVNDGDRFEVNQVRG